MSRKQVTIYILSEFLGIWDLQPSWKSCALAFRNRKMVQELCTVPAHICLPSPLSGVSLVLTSKSAYLCSCKTTPNQELSTCHRVSLTQTSSPLDSPVYGIFLSTISAHCKVAAQLESNQPAHAEGLSSSAGGGEKPHFL